MKDKGPQTDTQTETEEEAKEGKVGMGSGVLYRMI